MDPVQTIAPYAEPVSVAEAKQHAHIDVSDEDALVAGWIAAARQWCERFQRRQYVTATFRLRLDRFTDPTCHYLAPGANLLRSSEIRLPRAPLVSVSSIAYVDEDGDTQTLSTSVYTVDTDSEPGVVLPAYDQSWPSVRGQTNAVTITYVAGSATPFTVNASTNVLTARGRTYALNDVVRLTNSGGALPGGLATDTDYHVIDVSGSTFKLSTSSGGSAVDITDEGSGTHFLGAVPPAARQAMLLLIGSWSENREAVLTGTISKEIEFSVKSLLWPGRCF